MLSIALFLVAQQAPAVRVVGDGRCPSAADVQARIAQARPPLVARAAGPDELRVAQAGRDLVLTLVDARGATVAERRMPAQPHECADLAAAVAAMASAWELGLRAADVPDVPIAAPVPSPPPPPSAPPPGRGLELDVAAVAAIVLSDAAVPAAGIAGSLGPSGGGPGAWLSLAGTAERTDAFAGARASWRRLAATLGGRWRFRRAGWLADVRAGAVGSWLMARGSGFSRDLSASGFEPGGELGGRVGHRLGGALALWIDVAGTAWVRPQSVTAAPPDASRGLPRVQASVGLALGFCR